MLHDYRPRTAPRTDSFTGRGVGKTMRGLAPFLLGATSLVLLGSCINPFRNQERAEPAMKPAEIARLLPASLKDRDGWATDIHTAFEALDVRPTARRVCAVSAVVQQESSFQVDPPVPGLGAIAWKEIDARAQRYNIPPFAVRAALGMESPGGKTYRERIDQATTEKALSDVFEDFVGMVPLGRRLFADWNPVRTGGPMQVSIAFAEKLGRRGYPYPVTGGIRHEIFTRRGGLYFGIAHLLDYPADYEDMLFRFADFNAGHYASRNAAFQNAASIASKMPLALDGDLVIYGRNSNQPSNTELAVRALAAKLELSEGEIHDDLQQGEGEAFQETRTYERVFALADKQNRRALPRAVVPRIKLESAKITRRLTTEWFARRVKDRYQRCLGLK